MRRPQQATSQRDAKTTQETTRHTPHATHTTDKKTCTNHPIYLKKRGRRNPNGSHTHQLFFQISGFRISPKPDFSGDFRKNSPISQGEVEKFGAKRSALETGKEVGDEIL